MPFKKGESGSPDKVFKKGESGNPNGRPEGTSFKTIAEKILSGKITIEEAGEKFQMTRKEKMILEIINDACNDEDPNVRLKATAYVIERTEGKVPDKLDVTGLNVQLVNAPKDRISAILDELNEDDGGDGEP